MSEAKRGLFGRLFGAKTTDSRPTEPDDATAAPEAMPSDTPRDEAPAPETTPEPGPEPETAEVEAPADDTAATPVPDNAPPATAQVEAAPAEKPKSWLSQSNKIPRSWRRSRGNKVQLYFP